MTKEHLTNLWMQGLLMAAVVAVAVPVPDLALAAGNTLGAAANASGTSVFDGAVKIASYTSYAFGTVLGISGVLGLKKHSENPTNNPMGPGLGKVGAGGALIALPYVSGLLQGTTQSVTGGQVNFTALPGVN